MAWQPNPYGVPMNMGNGGYNPAPYMPSNGYSNGQQYGNINTAPISNPAPQMQPNVSIQGRMVTSREEALGIPVDFSGQPIFLADLGHNAIFVKKFNMNTGAADFAEFRLYNPQPAPQPAQQNMDTAMSNPTPDFAPLQDFRQLNDMVADMQNTIANLEKEIDRLKKPANSSGKTVKKDE